MVKFSFVKYLKIILPHFSLHGNSDSLCWKESEFLFFSCPMLCSGVFMYFPKNIRIYMNNHLFFY